MQLCCIFSLPALLSVPSRLSPDKTTLNVELHRSVALWCYSKGILIMICCNAEAKRKKALFDSTNPVFIPFSTIIFDLDASF